MKQEIWPYGKGLYKVLVEDKKVKVRIERWKDLKLSCRYSHPDGWCGWDYIFPARLYNKVAKLLGLPLQNKNPHRVLVGLSSKVSNGENRYDLTKVKS